MKCSKKDKRWQWWKLNTFLFAFEVDFVVSHSLDDELNIIAVTICQMCMLAKCE